MQPFHVLLMLFSILVVIAFVFLLRWEWLYFIKLEKAKSWLIVRIASIPILFITALIILVPVKSISGMEGLAVLYILLFTLAPAFWFFTHWLVGKFVNPPLKAGESALIAVSPIAFGIFMVLIAHQLQSVAWSLLRSVGIS